MVSGQWPMTGQSPFQIGSSQLGATDEQDGEAVLRFSAMGCEAEIRIAGTEPAIATRLLDQAADEVRRIEAKYSRYRPDSIVSRINAAAGSGRAVVVDDETADMLDFAARLYAESDGLFDITSGILRKAWNFRSTTLPSQTLLDELRRHIGWSRVAWSVDLMPRKIVLPEVGMELDFGGFGKEYAADRAAGVLLSQGVSNGYVNLGGDIRVLGPRSDGRGWSLGIRDPRSTNKTIAGVELVSGGLATSGDYERYMEVDGQRYCHILDPRSGWPVCYWQSVSIIAPLCIAAGALSTIAMLMGERAASYLQFQGVQFLAVDTSGHKFVSRISNEKKIRSGSTRQRQWR